MEYMLMPYNRYFDFSGRSSRTEYWMYSLFCFIVTLIGILLFVALGVDGGTRETNFFGWFLCTLGVMWLVGSIIPGLAVTVRRFHDAGYSGWFYLLNFIPYVGGLVVLAFMVMGSTPGDNQYGANPHGNRYGGY